LKDKSFLLRFLKKEALAFLVIGEESKRFFFEKKKQKTFARLGRAETGRGRFAGVSSNVGGFAL
jgi:hypothetical protein